jgi:putative Mn2+ efflux pump MntP
MHFVTGMFNIFVSSRGPLLWANFVSGVILAAIGISLIVKSRDVVGFLFKKEDE